MARLATRDAYGQRQRKLNLRTVWLADESGDYFRWDAASQHQFAELDEATASEVLADLEAIA